MPALTPFLRALTAFAASCVLVAATCGAPPAVAQQSQQQAAGQPLPAEQLDQLVAPIALYPDNLLGQILTAATYPLETVMAARWSAANPSLKGQALEDAMQRQAWDPSIKALTAVPQVLAMMSDKLDWTQALGDAYLSQPDDVAAAIQRLRIKAQANGNLQASSQQRIRRVRAPQPIIIDGRPEPEYIVIEPVNPDILYVPIYNPIVVYGPWAYPTYQPFYWYPPGYVAVGIIGFGVPFAVGAALWAQYNWESHHVDINIVNYNKFNHAKLVNNPANQIWQHDPLHRGNIPYNNAALQQKFGKPGTGNAVLNPGLQKTLTNTQPLNLKGGANPANNPITKLDTKLPLDKKVDLKVDKNTKLNVDAVSKSKTDSRTLDRRVNLNTGGKVNTNTVINNNAASNNNAGSNANRNLAVTRSVTPQNVTRNVQGGQGAVQKSKKPLHP
jgi:hypothetical protein